MFAWRQHAIAVSLCTSLVLAIAVFVSIPSHADPQRFPAIDRSRLLITLTRTACYGSCPDYVVTIDGAGRVLFTTSAPPLDGVAGLHREFNMPGVLWPGRHADQISAAAVDALVQRFRDARFFGLRDRYYAAVTDNPTYVVSIETGHGRKEVLDYVDGPPALKALEDAIDEAAGTDRWIRGANGLADYLAREGFDFRSRLAADLLLSGVHDADEETLIALIDRGAPLEGAAGEPEPNAPAMTVGAALTYQALLNGRPLLFERLAELGWLARLGPAAAAEAFAIGGAGCSPALVNAASRAGVAIDAPTNRPGYSTTGETALANIGRTYNCDRDEGARLAVARGLLALGADPNHRDGRGRTPIFGVDNLDIINLLLEHGASVTVQDNQGRNPVFATWTDANVLRLLEAGASPEGRYSDGKTLEQQTVARRMPRTARWLAEHAGRTPAR